MSKKKARKYKAIEHLEDGIKAYLFLNAVMENYKDEDHPHAAIARLVARVSLNEMLDLYLTNNGAEAFQKFADQFNEENMNGKESIPTAEGSNLSSSEPASVPSL